MSFILTSSAAAKTSALGDWLRQYRFDLGLSIPTLSVDVKRESTGQVVGRLIGRYLPQPVLSLSSPPHYLWKGFNYNFTFAYSWQALDLQQVNKQDVDLQSFSDAYGLYGLVLAGYTFGSKTVSRYRGFNFRLGGGLGTGWILAKGEVVLTEEPGTPRVTFNVNQFALIAALLAELRWKAYSIRMMLEAPTVTQEDLDLRFSFLKATLQLAYSFTASDFEAPKNYYKKARRNKKRIWTADFTAFSGARPVPVVSTVRYDPKQVTARGGGAQIAFKKKYWPLHIIIGGGSWTSKRLNVSTDFFDVPGNTKNASLKASSRSLDLGFRSIWREQKSLRPFVSGGITGFWSEVEGEIDTAPISDEAISFGFWLGGGIQWIVRQRWILSAELRGLDASSTFFNVRHQTIGLQSQASIGYHY